MNELVAKITASTSVAIRSNHPDYDLSNPLYAVNFFDASPAWLYHLYNRLASRSVRKIGGRPLFKGIVLDSILSDTGKRQILLIVKYPDAIAFKNLLESTYFKLVSILRIKSVQRFTFSFTKPQDDLNFDHEYKYYAIHHFGNRVISDVLKGIRNTKDDIDVVYAGKTSAHLFRQNKVTPDAQVESMIDNLIVYGSSSQEKLKSLLQSAEYLRRFDNEDPGYISTINRVL